MDVVAVNPFTVYPWSVIRGERKVRKVMRKCGQGRKPIWITEATWPASKGKAPGKDARLLAEAVGDRPVGMAKRLREVYKLLVKRAQARPDRARVLVHVGHRIRRATTSSTTPACCAGTAPPSSAPRRSGPTGHARQYQGCRKTGAGRCR